MNQMRAGHGVHCHVADQVPRSTRRRKKRGLALAPPLPQALPCDLPANSPVAERRSLLRCRKSSSDTSPAFGRIVPAAEPRMAIATRATPPRQVGGRQDARIGRAGARGPHASRRHRSDASPDRPRLDLRQVARERHATRSFSERRLAERPFAPFTETSFGDDATVTPEESAIKTCG